MSRFAGSRVPTRSYIDMPGLARGLMLFARRPTTYVRHRLRSVIHTPPGNCRNSMRRYRSRSNPLSFVIPYPPECNRVTPFGLSNTRKRRQVTFVFFDRRFTYRECRNIVSKRRDTFPVSSAMALPAGIFRHGAGKKAPKTKPLNHPVRTVLTNWLGRCTQRRLHRYHETIENLCDDGRCRLIFQ